MELEGKLIATIPCHEHFWELFRSLRTKILIQKEHTNGAFYQICENRKTKNSKRIVQIWDTVMLK